MTSRFVDRIDDDGNNQERRILDRHLGTTLCEQLIDRDGNTPFVRQPLDDRFIYSPWK